MSKTLKITGGTHANSRFERNISEAAPGCFFTFWIRVHSAIHLHCSGEYFYFYFF
jgi:hypothetical protein